MNLPHRLTCGCKATTLGHAETCTGPVAFPADDYAAMRKNEEVVITSITAAIVLLDRWIAYASELEVENQRLRSKYEAAHERCEMLRALVSEQVSDPFA